MANLQEQIPNVATSAGPAWVVCGNKTLLAWKGEGTDNGIYWSTTSALKPDSNSNVYNWTPQQKVAGVGTSASPALATFKGVVYMAWKGEGTDVTIYLSHLQVNGLWAPQQPVPGAGGTSDGPALAVTGGALYLAWKEEPGGTRIFWSKSTNGASWSPQAQVFGVGTSAGPALASDGVGAMYMAWKGESDDFLWWSKCSDGKTWAPQQKGPRGALASPGLAVDGNKVKWLAWTGIGGSNLITPPGVPSIVLPGVCFSKLVDESTNAWSPGATRLGFGTTTKPALLSTGNNDTDLMLAAAGPSENNFDPIVYGPLLLPAQLLQFCMNDLIVRMMRTGHATFKDGSDTVYANVGVKIKGQPVITNAKFVGNLTGGQYEVALGSPLFTIQDTDVVYITYSAINSGGAASSATAFLQNAASQVLNAAEKADEKAIEDITGLPLSELTPQEAGALIGAQLGGTILPGLGVVIGAIAGWFVDSVGGFLFPDCDGPVAVGLYVFSAPQIRQTLMQNNKVYIQTDDNPGTNSAGGCGDNSDYQVVWELCIPG